MQEGQSTSCIFGKRVNGGCKRLECDNEGRKEPDRFARKKYRDNRMREDAMKVKTPADHTIRSCSWQRNLVRTIVAIFCFKAMKRVVAPSIVTLHFWDYCFQLSSPLRRPRNWDCC